ncbi:GNAT family N-acetyltransferase [Paenibacillus sp. KS-LC4]|uniref:GNAT family N-acetyltransferase n=1 Tax=Paenibacillus sp. KS-LC4 TaxID=2979727 RepID=UPI0030D038FC
MDASHARQLCDWQYEPPYGIYQWPAWDAMEKAEMEFADPELRQKQYAAILDDQGELVGFAQFFPLGDDVLRLGLGRHPQLCSRGSGTAFVELLIEEARRRAPHSELDLEVLTWNARAIRVYEKAGFRITDTYIRPTPQGAAEFHCMVYGGEAET